MHSHSPWRLCIHVCMPRTHIHVCISTWDLAKHTVGPETSALCVQSNWDASRCLLTSPVLQAMLTTFVIPCHFMAWSGASQHRAHRGITGRLSETALMSTSAGAALRERFPRHSDTKAASAEGIWPRLHRNQRSLSKSRPVSVALIWNSDRFPTLGNVEPSKQSWIHCSFFFLPQISF